MPSLEFTLLVDAIKLPSASVVPRNATFELHWFFSEEHQGRSAAEAAVKDEIEFMMSAKWLVENRTTVGRVLQLSLFQNAPRAVEKELIGVLMIDLNAHIPKPPQRYSRQRATLMMSRCPYDHPAMIRLAVECVQSQMSVATIGTPMGSTTQLKGARQASASPAALPPAHAADASPEIRPRTGSTTSSAAPVAAAGALPTPRESSSSAFVPIDRELDLHAQSQPPTAASAAEVQRLKATISTMAAANEQLRDENAFLRRAASQARKEPDYTYTTAAAAGATGSGAADEATELRQEVERLRAEAATQRAEMAVLQRGVLASKEQLRAQLEREQELRAEIASLGRDNTFHRDTIRQLEREVEEARMRPFAAADARGGEIETLRSHLQQSQGAVRELSAANHANEQTIESLRRHLDDVQVALKESDARRMQVERQSSDAIAELQSKVERCEAALRLGQKEIQRLHKYCEDANERCHAFAKTVEAQRIAIERKKKKLADLRAFLNAQAVFANVKLPS